VQGQRPRKKKKEAQFRWRERNKKKGKEEAAGAPSNKKIPKKTDSTHWSQKD